ncbi:MAG: hypothetical protein O3A80_03210 [bacterium]|nr:hypothetical protein [bacterium]
MKNLEHHNAEPVGVDGIQNDTRKAIGKVNGFFDFVDPLVQGTSTAIGRGARMVGGAVRRVLFPK